MPTDRMELVYTLSNLLQGSLTSVEILPGGLKEWETIEMPSDTRKPSKDFPFVLVEGNLGIPKKVLRKLYLAAISTNWRLSSPKEAIATSGIAVLLNPAHQTALNTRKILIEEGHLDPREELTLTELISRGSPEAAKQSMLWDHRKWCFRRIYDVIGTNKVVPSLSGWVVAEELQFIPKMKPGAIQKELAFIRHACEIYHRNYHAWTHWHFIMDVSYASLYTSETNELQREFYGLILAEYTHLRSWVERHVSDYSAMYQLYQCQKLIDQFNSDGLSAGGVEHSCSLLDHAISLVKSFPKHESLWLYLRLSLDHLCLRERIKLLEEQDLPKTVFTEKLDAWLTRDSRDGPRRTT